MTAVLMTVGILIVILGILLSIALHEIGHLVPAKLFKVRVTQYMVGFGPTVWSKRRGETEYGIKAVPLGGYVAMIGMYPPPEEDSGGRGPVEEDEPAGLRTSTCGSWAVSTVCPSSPLLPKILLLRTRLPRTPLMGPGWSAPSPPGCSSRCRLRPARSLRRSCSRAMRTGCSTDFLSGSGSSSCWAVR